MADYNWEMTGPPDIVTQLTDPEAVASWNNYVEQATSDYGGGYDTPFAPQVIANPVYEDPTYWNSGNVAYQTGSGETAYAPSFLRPQEYLSNALAAPYSAEEIAQKVNPENIRYGYANTPYASVRGASDLSGGEYVVNPETGKFVLDANGNPVPVPQEPYKQGTFDNIMTTYVIPAMLAAGAIGTGAGALGLIGEGAALAGSGEAGLLGAGEGVVGQALPYTTSFDAANLYGQGLSQAAIEQNLAMTGIDSFLAADAASLASQGLSDAAIAQNLAYGYSPAELAGTGIESLAIPPASPGFGDFLSSFGNLLKTPLGQLGAKSGLGLLSSAANTAPKVPGAAAGGSYVPKGMVDYAGILNLLAPKTATRTSLLG